MRPAVVVRTFSKMVTQPLASYQSPIAFTNRLFHLKSQYVMAHHYHDIFVPVFVATTAYLA